MSPLSIKFSQELAQQSDALQHLTGDTTLSLFYPQPFTASATLCLSNSPWYLDYGHLSFWFFFFATFSIVLWLTYLFVALSRNVESRRIVRETRGFSRAQTGDTMTAVLPLTWSVTMLAHAGTHSSNFDENTNAAAFSFTVTAYQWGWNYLFPREIGDLLTNAPRFVGRGYIFYPRRGDLYGQLLARARHDFLQVTQANGRYAAQHGRLTPALPLQVLLPSLSLDSVELPAWVATGAPFIAGYSALAAQGSPLVSPFGCADLTTSKFELSLKSLRGPSRSCQLALDHVTRGEASLVVSAGMGWTPSPVTSDLSTSALLAPQTRLASPSLAAFATVGNRLNLVHRYLGTGDEGCHTRVATLLTLGSVLPSKLDPVGASLWVKLPSEAFTFENLRATAPAPFVGVGSYWAATLGSNTLPYGPTFLLCATSLREGTPLASTTQLWASYRGQGLSLLGGQSSVLTPADYWANTGAASAELNHLPAFETVGGSLIRVGVSLSSRLLLHSRLGPSSTILTSTTPVTFGVSTSSASLATAVFLANHAQVLTPLALKANLGAQLGGLYTGANLNPNAAATFSTFHLERLSPQLLLSHGKRPTVDYPAAGPIFPFEGDRINLINYNLAPLFCYVKSETLWPSIYSLKWHEFFIEEFAALHSVETMQAHNRIVASVHSFSVGIREGGFLLTTWDLTQLATTLSSSVAFLPLTAWLEGADLAQPLRTSAPAVGESGQINARIGGSDFVQTVLTSALPQHWRSTWSWYVMTAAFPWDRLCRAQFSRRPATGVRSDFSLSMGSLTGPEILSLQRQRFDKNQETPIHAYVDNTFHQFPRAELGRAVLDSSLGGILLAVASTLPAPHLDLDPSFIQTRWSGELSVSRRSDHDSKFSLSWGPILASLAVCSAESTTLTPWSELSDPRVLNSQASGLVALSFALLAQRSLATICVVPTSVKQGLCSQISAVTSLSMVPVRGRLVPRNLLQTGLQSLRYAPGVSTGFNPNYVLVQKHLQTRSWGLETLWEFKSTLVNQNEVFTSKLNLEAIHKVTPRLLLSHALLEQILGAPEGAQASKLLPFLLQPACTMRPLGYAGRAGYLPLSSDVSIQRRLRVTKGVYLPSDTPMHGIFGSKDVIHSWAIPALGVKIDCIPGFSSHRRLVLRWRGLYWGQCMEVCGRYHHWMPILIRVVHKDVFLAWCLAHIRLLNLRSGSVAYVVNAKTARTLWALASQPVVNFERA